jgi:hypothetical protein
MLPRKPKVQLRSITNSQLIDVGQEGEPASSERMTDRAGRATK